MQVDGQLVCRTCYLRFRRDIRICPGCAEPKVLAFHDAHQRPACAACTGNETIYACPQCGREDHPYGRLCARCTLAQRATELLADRNGRIHPRLRPVLDTWMAGKRPETTLAWFTKRSSCPELLQAMALGELPIAHATFDELPSTRNINYIRDLLTATGVLEPYEPLIARTTHWLGDLLDLLPKHHADLVERFARWHILRRLRLLEARSKVTRSSVQNARADFVATLRLLIWLDEHHLLLAETSQTDFDRYLAQYPGRGPILVRFIDWTNHTQITDNLRIPAPHRPDLQVELGDEQRWQHVETLLHDTTIRLYARIAGLFMLLFAQPLSRIARMHADQATVHPDGTVTITFDTIPIDMPEPLDQLIRQHLITGGPASYANQGRWLFPGRLPGKHLVTENIRGELVAHGIQPGQARKAAMFHLAATMPTPVLADLLGLSTTTAARWAVAAAAPWGQYAAQRHQARDDM
ncbi:zinc ribbon domain-containing protein [Nocardia niwae]|uniref:zinc ribbon domain-containing protein n=1 Tax=Nocardia niwae TaxID=626084 RepID=UPI0033E1878C